MGNSLHHLGSSSHYEVKPPAPTALYQNLYPPFTAAVSGYISPPQLPQHQMNQHQQQHPPQQQHQQAPQQTQQQQQTSQPPQQHTQMPQQPSTSSTPQSETPPSVPITPSTQPESSSNCTVDKINSSTPVHTSSPSTVSCDNRQPAWPSAHSVTDLLGSFSSMSMAFPRHPYHHSQYPHPNDHANNYNYYMYFQSCGSGQNASPHPLSNQLSPSFPSPFSNGLHNPGFANSFPASLQNGFANPLTMMGSMTVPTQSSGL